MFGRATPARFTLRMTLGAAGASTIEVAFASAVWITPERNTRNVKHSFVRRGVLVASTVGVLVSPFLGSIQSAHAVVPTGQIVVAAGGSDTTEKIMNDIAAADDGTQVDIAGTATTVRVFNIPTDPKPSPFVVPGDTGNGCNADQNWVKDPLAPAANTSPTLGTSPFGSTAGRNYLAAEDGGTLASSAGCIDVARASNTPRGTAGGDKATFENFAFALDSVSWATTSLKAPPTLSLAQIQGIYACTITDWSAVGGVAGPIQRYFPQVGSGTRSFFISDILGGVTPVDHPGTCPNMKLIEENQANGGILGTSNSVVDADIDKAILPYSAAVWSFQESKRINPTLDRRKGARLGAITASSLTASPIAWDGVGRNYFLDTSTVVTEANVKLNNSTVAFPGIRYVWNVVDSAGPTNSYLAARKLFGFVNTPSSTDISPLCSNSPAGDARQSAAYFAILSNGFAPLSTADAPGSGANSNVTGATCRRFTAA